MAVLETQENLRIFDFGKNSYHLMLSAGSLMQDHDDLLDNIFDKKHNLGVTSQKVYPTKMKVLPNFILYHFYAKYFLLEIKIVFRSQY